jgi:hypothetical protein
MAAVKREPDIEISRILSTSAVARDKRKIGKAMLNFIDRNREKTNNELYIHALGITVLKRNTATEG